MRSRVLAAAASFFSSEAVGTAVVVCMANPACWVPAAVVGGAAAGAIGAVLNYEGGSWIINDSGAFADWAMSHSGDSGDAGDKPSADGDKVVQLPSDLVGSQDEQARQQGKRHVSGPLAPEHGGTGEAAADFDKLTGGRSKPAPDTMGLPPGSRIGVDNKVIYRPGTSTSGPRIDIPADGSKPHETLHYPIRRS